MINIQRTIRFRSVCVRHLKKLRFNDFGLEYKCSNYNFIETNYDQSPQISLRGSSMFYVNSYSTFVKSHTEEELIDVNLFEKVCEETLESLTDFFEELCESKEALKNTDVAYSNGVLTVNLGKKLGTYVINRQSPNRQIWLSSPVSGPKRYDYIINGKYWIYKHDLIPLHKLLQAEISEILGENIDLSKCLHSKV